MAETIALARPGHVGLPKLELADRREIFERICDMEARDCSMAACRPLRKKRCSAANSKPVAKIPTPVPLGPKPKPVSANNFNTVGVTYL
jgi:hypothetical protein